MYVIKIADKLYYSALTASGETRSLSRAERFHRIEHMVETIKALRTLKGYKIFFIHEIFENGITELRTIYIDNATMTQLTGIDRAHRVRSI